MLFGVALQNKGTPVTHTHTQCRKQLIAVRLSTANISTSLVLYLHTVEVVSLTPGLYLTLNMASPALVGHSLSANVKILFQIVLCDREDVRNVLSGVKGFGSTEKIEYFQQQGLESDK